MLKMVERTNKQPTVCTVVRFFYDENFYQNFSIDIISFILA